MLGLCSPSAQMTASAKLLLPLPLGPMMTPTPGSKSSSVCRGNDLKPLSRSALRYTSDDLGGVAGAAGLRPVRSGRHGLAGAALGHGIRAP